MVMVILIQIKLEYFQQFFFHFRKSVINGDLTLRFVSRRHIFLQDFYHRASLQHYGVIVMHLGHIIYFIK